uniref:Uncharacterized protein n=1 Tax=candidate division WWE3 bacterium TaxID=2053526 RepID=A0A7C4TJT7_UNCKA
MLQKVAKATFVTRTVREVVYGLIYFTSAVYGQTTAIHLSLFPDAQSGDQLQIGLEEERPIRVTKRLV